ncbi:hypothetical protein EVAR_31647_1 [Eumeta japonica]|uniref:Uncharacterized protein n=1 Tax=Eumeta variegata TaxID=151549 RepID=A0A4C1VZH1_EUMVA|nr:hypothetical protein EVAR_31647_1 [Eumeta japonica]
MYSAQMKIKSTVEKPLYKQYANIQFERCRPRRSAAVGGLHTLIDSSKQRCLSNDGTCGPILQIESDTEIYIETEIEIGAEIKGETGVGMVKKIEIPFAVNDRSTKRTIRSRDLDHKTFTLAPCGSQAASTLDLRHQREENTRGGSLNF